jgi:hypothetical protein
MAIYIGIRWSINEYTHAQIHIASTPVDPEAKTAEEVPEASGTHNARLYHKVKDYLLHFIYDIFLMWQHIY